jgi:hypothetical protein
MLTGRICLAFAFAFVVGGCGVPVEGEPRPISIDATGSASGSDAIAPQVDPGTGSGRIEETLYFVREGRLVAVRRPVDRAPSPENQFQHLLAGPTDAEHDQGLSSVLTGLGITAHLRITGLAAVVDLGVQPDNAGRSDEVLAYGQIVCTLTTRPDIDTVSFRYDGEPVDVPRGDASLGRQPLTAADYRNLLAPD